MIRLLMLAAIGVLVTAAALAAETADAEAAGSGCAQIVYVIDGDTVIARDCNGGREFRIRLSGVNAAELDEASGEAARRALQALLPVGRRAAFEWYGYTSYGRYVGAIHFRTPAGMLDVNQAMHSFLDGRLPSTSAAPSTVPARVSDPSCASTAGGWVTVGPCYRESFGYRSRYDADGDGVSCERGCRFYRRANSSGSAGAPSSSSGGSSSGTASGSQAGRGWVTIGPCSRGQSCYSPRGDGDSDGVSCERGCRVWRP